MKKHKLTIIRNDGSTKEVDISPLQRKETLTVTELAIVVNHLANIIIDVAGQDYVSGNQLNTANDYLDKVIPLL